MCWSRTHFQNPCIWLSPIVNLIPDPLYQQFGEVPPPPAPLGQPLRFSVVWNADSCWPWLWFSGCQSSMRGHSWSPITICMHIHPSQSNVWHHILMHQWLLVTVEREHLIGSKDICHVVYQPIIVFRLLCKLWVFSTFLMTWYKRWSSANSIIITMILADVYVHTLMFTSIIVSLNL